MDDYLAKKRLKESGLLAQEHINPEEFLMLKWEAVCPLFKTHESGLSEEEAKGRIEIYGHNELAKKKRKSIFMKFFAQLWNPLIIILLFAAGISGFLGEMLDMVIIFCMIFLSIVLDVYQESKAEKAAEMLKEKVRTTATVLRNGVKKEISISEIVPGDVINISAGDIVPADAKIIMSKDLFINQSALTGESFPVEKSTEPLETKSSSLADWKNYLFMGTSAVSGTATAIVIGTGRFTEYGRIAKNLASQRPETEYEAGMKKFGFLIMKAIFFLVIFVFFINTLLRHNALESLLFAVALAVGLTPEFLPMIVTISLSKGAIEMSKRGVIVKRLVSIENLGSMDVFCTDKTGTLTENKVELLMHIDPQGKDSKKVMLYSYLNSLYESGLKSPLDEAILKHDKIDTTGYKKLEEIPFDFVRRRISIVVESKKEKMLIAKGATEEILEVCLYYDVGKNKKLMTSKSKKEIKKKYEELSEKGFRVLGVAYKKFEDKNKKERYSKSDESKLVFAGFVAFVDPPKQTAKESLQLLANNGIDLKIITGDNELVTKNICMELGFKIKGILLGTEIANLDDDSLIRSVENANIFARLTPAQKDRVINALKKNNHVVGFLGDGINDASSLRIADVGVSVDNAVDVAKESADIILLQKDLTVLNEGVMDGRKTFGNTMKYIMMGTSSNFGNMFSVAGASLFLPFLPMLPIQILLNNFLYDFSQMTLPVDHVDREYTEKPKRWDIGFIKRFMIFFGPISSFFDFMTFFIMIYIFSATAALFQTAWFVESLCTQTIVIFVIRTRMTPFFKSRPKKLLLFSNLLIVVIALALPFTKLGGFFKMVPLPGLFYVILAGMIICYVIMVEAMKVWFYKKYYPETTSLKLNN